MAINQSTFNTKSVVQLFVGNRENGLEYLNNLPSDFVTKLDEPIHLSNNTYVRLTSLTNNEPYNPYFESIRELRTNPTSTPLFEAGFITLCLTSLRNAGGEDNVTPAGVNQYVRFQHKYFMEVYTNSKTYMGPTWRPVYDHGKFINDIYDEKSTRLMQFDGIFGANTNQAGARTRYRNTRQRFEDPLTGLGAIQGTQHRHWVREEDEFTLKGVNVLELDHLEQLFIKECRPFNQRWYNVSHAGVNDDQANEAITDEYFKFEVTGNEYTVHPHRHNRWTPLQHLNTRDVYSLCSLNSPSVINGQKNAREVRAIYDKGGMNIPNYTYFFPNVVHRTDGWDMAPDPAEWGTLTFLPVGMGPQHFVDLFYVNGGTSIDGTTLYDVGRSNFYKKRRERLSINHTALTNNETFLFSTNIKFERLFGAGGNDLGVQIFIKIPYFSTANYSSQCESYSSYFLGIDESELPTNYNFHQHRWLDVPCQQKKAPIIGGGGFKWGVYMQDLDTIFEDLITKLDFAKDRMGDNTKGAGNAIAGAVRRNQLVAAQEVESYYELLKLAKPRLKKMLAESCIGTDRVFKKKLQQLQTERQVEDVWNLAKVFTGMVEAKSSKLYEGVIGECFTQELDPEGNPGGLGLQFYPDEVYKAVNEYYQHVNQPNQLSNLIEQKADNKFVNIKRYTNTRKMIDLFRSVADANNLFLAWGAKHANSTGNSFSLVSPFNKSPRNYTKGHDTFYVYAEGLIEDKKVFGFRSPLLATGNFLTSTNYPTYSTFGEDNELKANLTTQPPTQFLNMKLSTDMESKVKSSVIDAIRIQIGLPDGTLALLPEHSNTTGIVEFYTK